MTNMQIKHVILIGWVVYQNQRVSFYEIYVYNQKQKQIYSSNKQKYYPVYQINWLIQWQVYWSTLKMFLNNEKIPCTSPFSQQNKCVADFKEKVEVFISFFAEEWSFMNISSKFPSVL